MNMTRLLALTALTALIGCTTASSGAAPDPEPYDPVMGYTQHGSAYGWELAVLDARLADLESMPPEEVAGYVETCALILEANPDHPDAPGVAAHLERLRAIVAATPPSSARLVTDAQGTSIQRVDMNALRRDVQYANVRNYAQTLSVIRTWIAHNPHHGVTPELREMAATLEVVPVNEAARLANYYATSSANTGAYHASAFALRAEPGALVEFAFVEHYAPRGRDAAPTATLRPRGRAPLATRGPGRPIPLTRAASYACSRLHLALPSLTSRWGAECHREASAAWVAGLVDMPLYTQDGKLDPKALDATLTAIALSPDDSLAGLPARDLYALYQPTVAAHLRIWKNIQRVGERKIMKAWRAEKKRTDKNGGSLIYSFYSNRDRFPGVFEGFGQDDWHAPSIYGFWLRRIDDGTARVLLDHAKKITSTYDPELHDEIF